MRTTIWIPDEVIKEMKEEAWRQRKSLSGYLVGLHTGGVVKKSVAPIGKEVVGFFNPQPKGGKR